MSVFDNIDKGSKIGGFFKTDPKSRVTIESKQTPRTLAAGEKLKSIENSRAAFEATRRTTEQAPIFSSMRKPATILGVSQENASDTEIAKYIVDARAVLTESLTDKLFVDRIHAIVTEACPMDKDIIENPAMKEYLYDMTMEMYSDLKRLKNIPTLVMEGKLPTAICDLYCLAHECAQTDASLRLNVATVMSECGRSIEKINEFVANQLAAVTVESDELAEEFGCTMDLIVLENEDVAAMIKDKVTGDLEDYKKSAKQVDDVKKSVAEISSSDPKTEPPAAPSPETNSTDDGGNTQENPAENLEQNGGSDASNSTQDDSGDKGAGNGGNADSEPKTPEKDQDPDKGGGTADPEPKTPEKDEDETTPEAQAAITESVSAEIEDAASFAESKSNTFNTGDEKFEALRAKYSNEIIDAVNRGDVDRLNALKAKISTASARIKTINECSNGKYADTSKKFAELECSVSMEINKVIQGKQSVTREGYSIFENFVLSIGKRHLNKITTEGGDISQLPGTQIVQEAVIYQTMLETFHTLRLLNVENESEFKAFESFMSSVASR